MQFFPHAEGYVSVVDDKYNYVFNYTDHLGNIRVSYGVDPSTGTLKVLEENHYYAFGLKHEGYNMDYKMYQKIQSGAIAIRLAAPLQPNYTYKYNGKELQTELGLNMYDYGARNYDPALGRWMNVDPLAENSRRWNPYNYAYNNPIYFIDPDGMQSEGNDWKRNGDGTYTAEDGDSAWTLAEDAGITFDRAKELLAGQKKQNVDWNMDTYTDSEDGVEKSRVDTGDIVAVPEQVEQYKEEKKKEEIKKEKIEGNNKKIVKIEKSIDSMVKVDKSLESDKSNVRINWRSGGGDPHTMMDLMRNKKTDEIDVEIVRNKKEINKKVNQKKQLVKENKKLND